MKIYELDEYKEDIAYIAGLDLPWEKLKNTSMLISGASGLIGSVLVDTVMYLNRTLGINCRVLALGRNEAKAKERFGEFLNDPNFSFISADINKPLVLEELDGGIVLCFVIMPVKDHHVPRNLRQRLHGGEVAAAVMLLQQLVAPYAHAQVLLFQEVI